MFAMSVEHFDPLRVIHGFDVCFSLILLLGCLLISRRLDLTESFMFGAVNALLRFLYIALV